MSLLHHNIRSLNAHFGELIALLHSLGNNFDLIAFSENGNHNIDSRKSELKKFGYELLHEPSKLSKGGVGLLHDKTNVDLIERPDLKISPTVPHVINGSNMV